MKKKDDLVISTDEAGKFSAEETSRLAALAAFRSSSNGKRSIDRVLKSLDGRAKEVGVCVLSDAAIGVGYGHSKKKTAAVTKKVNLSGTAKNDGSVNRLVKWGRKVG